MYLPSYNQMLLYEEESVIDLTVGMMLSVEIEWYNKVSV